MQETIQKIGEAFRLPGKLENLETITNGNINMTCRAVYRQQDGTVKTYIFQRMNTVVFHNPVEIMKNIDLVTSHIARKYPEERTLHFHHTAEGKNYVFDEDGCFWRVMDWIDSITFDTCDDFNVIAATGKAFGRFQNQLADFDGSKLYETIPDFHNTQKRLDTLFLHVEQDPCGRAAEVQPEIDYIASVRSCAEEMSIRYANGEFPIRVTHNDTKANNVLFDRKTKMPIAVIDLDTVMPGMAMFDFGDAVRFLANNAPEDEADIDRVFLDTEKFRAFSRGFIGETADSLTPAELDALVQAAFSVTVELASRFLDDYLTGDTYFKICYPEHNLVRTRCQLALARDIAKKREQLEEIVRETVKEARA